MVDGNRQRRRGGPGGGRQHRRASAAGSDLLIAHAFHGVAVDAHGNGILALLPCQILVDRIDMGADEDDKCIQQLTVLL